MAKYLIIESRDPFEWAEVGRTYELAAGLRREGNDVTVYLVQNGVLPARFGAQADGFSELTQNGVEVLADSFSLRERAIQQDQLVQGVSPAQLDVVVDRLADGWKAIWD